MTRIKRKPNGPEIKFLSRKSVRLVFIFLLLISFYQIGVRYAEPRLLPIHHIQMNSNFERIDSNALKALIKPKIKGFFSTNTMALKREIQAVPFVDEVFIKRVWPDTLLVTLTEVTLVASWGEEAAVSSRGEVIQVKVNPSQHLPNFIGPEGQAANIYNNYNELTAILKPLHLSIAEIALNMRHSWQLTLDNNIKISLGRRDIAKRLSDFVAIYSKLKKIHGDNLKSIDLRHSNGISVYLLKNKASSIE